MKKIAVVFGTRPEAIKMAPIIIALRRIRGVKTYVCVTAQHRRMLDQVLDTFGIVPDVDLNLMRPDQTLAELTSRAIGALDGVFSRIKPHLVLAQGDTTTVFCSALASFYRHIPFGHVEAGLRTGDLRAPWPEEGNRQLVSRMSDLHFAPTRASKLNLIRESVPAARIFVTGNTVIDALYLAIKMIKKSPPVILGLPVSALKRRIVLITGHRRENFGEGFKQICNAIVRLSGRFSNVEFVYPVHLNPSVRRPVHQFFGRRAAFRNVHLLAPLQYLPFVRLMEASTLILTDSGGVQEEGPSLGKPVLVMREVTERPEAIAGGTVRLVGAKTNAIVAAISRLLTIESEYLKMARVHNPYGDGKAADRVVAECLRFLR